MIDTDWHAECGILILNGWLTQTRYDCIATSNILILGVLSLFINHMKVEKCKKIKQALTLSYHCADK